MNEEERAKALYAAQIELKTALYKYSLLVTSDMGELDYVKRVVNESVERELQIIQSRRNNK